MELVGLHLSRIDGTILGRITLLIRRAENFPRSDSILLINRGPMLKLNLSSISRFNWSASTRRFFRFPLAMDTACVIK